MVDLCPNSRSSDPGHRDGAGPCSVPGVHGKLEKEQSGASATGQLSSSSVSFYDNEFLSNSLRVTSLPTREACDCSQGLMAVSVVIPFSLLRVRHIQ